MVTDQHAQQNSFVRALAGNCLHRVLFQACSKMATGCWLGEHKGDLDAKTPVFSLRKTKTQTSMRIQSFVIPLLSSKLTTSKISVFS